MTAPNGDAPYGLRMCPLISIIGHERVPKIIINDNNIFKLQLAFCADLPLALTVSCFSKVQIGFTFLLPAHLGSPGKGPLNGCVCCLLKLLPVVPTLYLKNMFRPL